MNIRLGEIVFNWTTEVPSCPMEEYITSTNGCGSCVVVNNMSAVCSNISLSTVASVCVFTVSRRACGFDGTPNSVNVTVKGMCQSIHT